MNEKFANFLVKLTNLCIGENSGRQVSLYHNYQSANACKILIEYTDRIVGDQESPVDIVMIPGRFFTVFQKFFPGVQFWILTRSWQPPYSTIVEVDFGARHEHNVKRIDILLKKADELLKKEFS